MPLTRETVAEERIGFLEPEMSAPKTPPSFDEKEEKVKFEEPGKPDESHSNDNDGPIPPDGGYGWVIVFASFMANTVVDGIAYSFGIMLPELHSYFKGSVQTVAWVGSVLVGVYSLTGPIASGMINKFSARSVCIAGATIGMLGFVSSTWATSLLFLMLTYGVLGGIGLGFIYIPACVYVSYYFEKKRSLATGIAVAGSGFGTFVFAPLTTALLEHYGWKGTLWILSGMVANCGVFGALLWPLRQSKASAISQERRSTLVDIPELSVAEEALLAQENENTALVKPLENTRPNATAMNHEAVKCDIFRIVLMVIWYISATEPSARRRSHKYSLENVFYPNRDPKMRHKSLSHLHISRQRSSGFSKQRTHSLHSLYFPTANPADLYKPFSRKDIFYPGSVHKLQEITSQSNAFIPSERRPTADHSDVDEFVEQLIAEGQPTKSRRCPCLPPSVSNVVLNMVNYRLLSHPSMLILCVANIVGMLGFYVPFVYLTAYAESLGSTKEQSSLLLSVIGITNTIGRVLFGWISDQRWVTALTINNISLLFCGALTSLCMVFGSYTLLMTYSVLFGLFIAPYISLTAVILVEEVGLEQLTNAFGLLVLARGVSAMVGSPIGGAVYDSTGAYKFSFLVAGALIFASGLIHYLIPLYHWLRGKGILKDSRQV
ncbi:MFS 1 domain containing protein [Trichuris trichiura]|uniref:MFS 1 domain containing protein n=1 Tax=Trichuris trichiura TaxID=36087 RepID=A0A077Z4T0_TRITR|nr:MFS 1 domain containing protein [Trichuris trichiura]